MGITYYRDLLRGAVCSMAACSGNYNERLRIAWSGYIYKFRWEELERLSWPEGASTFEAIQKALRFDILAAVDQLVEEGYQQTRNAPNPRTREELRSRFGAEDAIRRMHWRQAKQSVQSIMDFYNVVVSTVDFEQTVASRPGGIPG